MTGGQALRRATAGNEMLDRLFRPFAGTESPAEKKKGRLAPAPISSCC
jgi:hypothetical protein